MSEELKIPDDLKLAYKKTGDPEFKWPPFLVQDLIERIARETARADKAEADCKSKDRHIVGLESSLAASIEREHNYQARCAELEAALKHAASVMRSSYDFDTFPDGSVAREVTSIDMKVPS